MKSNSTHVRKGSFTGIGVTERHFVTTGAGGECPSLPQDHKCFEPVTRRFQPDPNVLEKLVEVLRQLLLIGPDCELQATCISGATE